MHLVIGGTGTVGTALCGELYKRGLNYTATSRSGDRGGKIKFDLRDPDMMALPPNPDAIYLVAAVAGFGPCETDRDAYRVNVDGPRALIRRFPKAFFIFISSDVVEMPGSASYQVHKRAVEEMIDRIGGAVVRPARVTSSYYAGELAKWIVSTGLGRRHGGSRWPSLELF